jgi:valyl-tRNA synthetase
MRHRAFYRGMDRFEARERIVEDLRRLGLLERIDDHRLKVPAAIAAAWSSSPS